MKITTLTAIVYAFLAAAGASAASINAPVTATALDNGLKVIVQEDHSTDLVAVDIWVRAGSVNETDDTNGVSHFIEHLLFRATDKRGPGEIDMEIESLGASAEAKTSRDWAHVYTVVAGRYLEKALDILSDAIVHPAFRLEDVSHERQVIQDEIARRDSRPLDLLHAKVFSAAYTVHPYRLPAEGTPESVEKITRDVIVDYYKKYYVPENTCVVLVGDITPAEGTAAAQKAFADFKKAPVHQSETPKEPARTEPKREVIKKDTKLSYLAVAFLAPSVKDKPDFYAMDVLLSYLGIGYQSWLAVELQDRQKLALEVSSDFLTQRDPGLAILTITTLSSKLQKAEEAIFAKIGELRSKPLGEAELTRAKRSLLGAYAFDVETFIGRATTLGFYESMDSFETARTYQQSIMSVTAEDIIALAKKYLDPNRAVVVVLGG
ncbi:MAG: insulinase family protein [Armatimonadetes bacterium]|nr:insulinase family protein [Armatimonadota bacterium]